MTRTFHFTVSPNNPAANDWLNNASPEDLRGTLEVARDLACDLDSPIVLNDAAGFPCFHVAPDGNYQAA